MPITSPAGTAHETLKATPHSWWSKSERRDSTQCAVTRLEKDIFIPRLRPRFRFSAKSRIYAMGSCFVRVIEKRLIDRGFSVPDPGTALAARWKHRSGQDPFGPWDAAAYLNKYNTYAMLNEVKRACLGPESTPDFVIPLADNQWMDIGASNILADWSEQAVRERRAIVDAHSRHMCECDIFILTLGLTEGWFNTRLGVHVNDHVGAGSEVSRNDFQFVVYDFNDHMEALSQLYRVLKERNPKCRFIVTVSPVPLHATFTGQDVVIANAFSKATLRSVAGAFCAAHADVDYFPSYEMVMFSNQAIAWREDRRHVDSALTTAIAQTFTENFIESGPSN